VFQFPLGSHWRWCPLLWFGYNYHHLFQWGFSDHVRLWNSFLANPDTFHLTDKVGLLWHASVHLKCLQNHIHKYTIQDNKYLDFEIKKKKIKEE
jgi:hypothetical protein